MTYFFIDVLREPVAHIEEWKTHQMCTPMQAWSLSRLMYIRAEVQHTYSTSPEIEKINRNIEAVRIVRDAREEYSRYERS